MKNSERCSLGGQVGMVSDDQCQTGQQMRQRLSRALPIDEPRFFVRQFTPADKAIIETSRHVDIVYFETVLGTGLLWRSDVVFMVMAVSRHVPI